MEIIKDKKIGLALGGGFSRAAAHIGVLKSLQKHEIPIDIVSGVSSGSIVAACYATDTLQKLEDYLKQVSLFDYLKLLSFKVSKQGFVDGNSVEKELRDLTDNKDFSETDFKLILSAADLFAGNLELIDKGNIARAIRVACAVPGIFYPIYQEQKCLNDAGIFTDMYGQGLYNYGADYVIGVNVSFDKKFVSRLIANFKKVYWSILGEKSPELKEITKKQEINLFRNVVRSYHINTHNIAKGSFRKEEVDMLVKPDVRFMGRFGVKMMTECIDAGERIMDEQIPELIKDLKVKKII